MYFFRDSATLSNNQISEKISNKEIIEPLLVVNYSTNEEKHIDNIFDNELNDVTTDVYTSVAVTEENKLKVSFCAFNPDT